MIKSQLILRLASRYKHLVQQDAEIALNLIIGAMIEAISQGRRIEIRGFGSFDLRQRKARVARNPRTGEAVNVPAKPHIYFRPTGDLKRRVGGGVLREVNQPELAKSVAIESPVGVAGNGKIALRNMVNRLDSEG